MESTFLTLVDGNVLERKLLEGALFHKANLVRCHANFGVLGNKPNGDNVARSSFVRVRTMMLTLGVHLWNSRLQSGFRNDDEMWTGNGSVMFEIGEE
jgi:hypothetical protein